MSDETTEEGKERPKLKSLEEFKPEESTGRIFDFQKHKEEKEDEEDDGVLWPPKIRTKFCFKHDEEIFNFQVEPCGDGLHINFVTMKELQTPFGKMIAQQPVTESHIELNKFEKFLTFLGFKFDLEKKVAIEAGNMKKKIVKFLETRKNAEKIKSKFKL